jgi:hypothetical protein
MTMSEENAEKQSAVEIDPERKIITWEQAHRTIESIFDQFKQHVEARLGATGEGFMQPRCRTVFRRVWHQHRKRALEQIEESLWRQTKRRTYGPTSTRNLDA